MSIATACPSSQRLNEWCSGLVAGDDFELICGHVERCDACQKRLASIDPADDFVCRLRQIPEEIWDSTDVRTTLGFARSDTAVPDCAIEIGDLIDVYRVESLISHGGMGSVFRAQHTLLRRPVALKVLEYHVPNKLALQRRFRAEWLAMGRITDSRIVQPNHAGEYHGHLFLAMDLLHGVDSGKLVRRCGRLSVGHAASIGVQAAEGLEAVHRAALVHRDVKPTNLMVQKDGSVRILDLGLAIAVDAGSQSRSMTDLGQFVGTAEYASPEQISHSSSVDWRTDQYSLGCTLYFLLTGRVPFPTSDAGSLRQVLVAHLQKTAPPLIEFRQDVPLPMVEAVHRAMSRDPSDRFTSMAEFAEALRAYADVTGLPEVVHEAMQGEPTAPTWKSSRSTIRIGQTRSNSQRPGPSTPSVPQRTLLDRIRPPVIWLAIIVAFVAPLWILVLTNSLFPRSEMTNGLAPTSDGAQRIPDHALTDIAHSAQRNVFHTAGPHRGFEPSVGHPVAGSEIVVQLTNHGPADRIVHYLEAKPGQMTIRFRPDHGGLMKSGLIEVLRFRSDVHENADPMAEPHVVVQDEVLTADKPFSSFEIERGTRKQGFFPVHVDRTSGRPKWNGSEGLQPHSFVFYCYPDLTFENASMTSLLVQSGQSVSLNLDVFNRGTARASAGQVAVGLQRSSEMIANNSCVFADYPELEPGQRKSLAIRLQLPHVRNDTVLYLTFRIDITNTTHPERDELPMANWDARSDDFLVLAHDPLHVPPNNHGLFRLEVRK